MYITVIFTAMHIYIPFDSVSEVKHSKLQSILITNKDIFF